MPEKSTTVDENSADAATASAGRLANRRQVLGALPVAAAVAASGALRSGKLMAKGAPAIPSITIPKEFIQSRNEKPEVFSFGKKGGISGAEVFAQLCKEENLAALFCCPGDYTVVNALCAVGIPSYGGRTENSMASAADGYSRATGEVVACSGTEGPGFTNMIESIAAAHIANTPLLVLASNVELANEDNYAGIQFLYQQPITTGIKKYGKRMILPNRVWEYGGYAFRALKTDVPGPVHLDFPGEVARARWTGSAQLTKYYPKSKYRTTSRPQPSAKDVAKAVELIGSAQRPLLIAGYGTFYRKAWDTIRTVAEKNEIAVCTSGPTRGHFPDDHRLSISLSPDALLSADLVIFVGQYLMPNRTDYRLNPDIRAIRVHPTAGDIGRNWPIDLGIVSDEQAFLEALAESLPSRRRDGWVSELAKARQAYEKQLEKYYDLGLRYSERTNRVHPAVIGHEIHQFLYKGKIDPMQTVTGWDGWTCQRFVNPMLRANRPAQEIVVPYQLGVIGAGLSMMIGATAAVKEGIGPQARYKGAPTLLMGSDAGIGYCLLELDTAAKYKLPLIAVVYNNNAWGTWPFADGYPRALQIQLFQENLRYDKAAEGLGAHGEYVTTPAEFRRALARSYEIAVRESIPSLINVQAIKEFTSPRDYPPGVGLNPEPGVGGFMH